MILEGGVNVIYKRFELDVSSINIVNRNVEESKIFIFKIEKDIDLGYEQEPSLF